MKRALPRFEVIEVVVGGRKRFLAYDYLLKIDRHPVDTRSQVQAQALVEMLADEARKKGEPLSVERTDRPPVQKQPKKS